MVVFNWNTPSYCISRKDINLVQLDKEGNLNYFLTKVYLRICKQYQKLCRDHILCRQLSTTEFLFIAICLSILASLYPRIYVKVLLYID